MNVKLQSVMVFEVSRSILQNTYVAIPLLECKISIFLITLLRNVEMHVDSGKPTQIIAFLLVFSL